MSCKVINLLFSIKFDFVLGHAGMMRPFSLTEVLFKADNLHFGDVIKMNGMFVCIEEFRN